MQKNKILNKYLIPHYTAATVFVLLSVAYAAMLPKNSKLGNLIFQDELRGRSGTKNFALVMMILVCLGLASSESVIIPKKAHKKTNDLTVEYLQHIFQKYPELKKYEFIFTDKKKLSEIASVICNGLNRQEQEKILVIIQKTFNKSNDEIKSYAEEAAEIVKAEEDIINIIKKHAAKHPEYMQNVLSAIDKNIYIMAVNGKNSILFSEGNKR